MRRVKYAVLVKNAVILLFATLSFLTVSCDDDSRQDNFTTCPVATRAKVIIDADVVEVFDDGVALMMLASDPTIDVLGVTTVTGNEWSSSCVAHAIRQLEAIGETSIPVVEGASRPLYPEKFFSLEEDWKSIGYVVDYMGALSNTEYSTWTEAYKRFYNTTPTMTTLNKSAEDFIIETVKNNPNEVTLFVIGPCTNIAKAVQKAPEIVPLIKNVVYMGGAFYCDGYDVPWAEFNWIADPDAAQICVNTAFKDQLIIGQDVSNKVTMDSAYYFNLIDVTSNTIINQMLKNKYLFAKFSSGAVDKWCLWDVIAAACVIDPTLEQDVISRYITIDTEGAKRGHVNVYETKPSSDAQSVRILMNTDAERVRTMITDVFENL